MLQTTHTYVNTHTQIYAKMHTMQKHSHILYWPLHCQGQWGRAVDSYFWVQLCRWSPPGWRSDCLVLSEWHAHPLECVAHRLGTAARKGKTTIHHAHVENPITPHTQQLLSDDLYSIYCGKPVVNKRKTHLCTNYWNLSALEGAKLKHSNLYSDLHA